MAIPDINIDSIVDYKAEYSSVIKKHTISGDQLVGVCPFHDDRKESFSADLKTGQWYCFAEGRGGNFTSFWAELKGIDTKEAYKQILDKYGARRDPEEKPKKKDSSPKPLPYTLKEYAFEKRLPEDWLKDACGAVTSKDRDRIQFVKFPYFDESGQSEVFRKRYGNKGFRWSWGSQGKLILYGEWRLPEIRRGGKVILVEGESDTQTLWHLKLPALGVPGASNFKQKFVKRLQDLKIYIHVEPDRGGETFLQKVTQTLREGSFLGEVYRWSCHSFGAKDPSELYLRDGAEEAARLIMSAVMSAEKIDLDSLKDIVPAAIEGAPVNLRQPAGFSYSEDGISRIDERTQLPVRICRTPIIITKRLRSLDSAEEKIEIAFKRDGSWHSSIHPRSTVFTARSITALADRGCTITSENAKHVVQYLEALEAENIDIITTANSTGTLGWQSGRRFLPGYGGGIVLDIDPSLQGWAAAYHQSGTFENWITLMAPHRARDRFRFILAAAFAAPLLKILSQRIFFVYNWGGSKGGKTAALKAALSAWGDPDRLMVNFNATQVALERMAAFYNDLPLGIDERQLAGDKQKSLESIVYMISGGTGKARGSKTGGLQTLSTWRTVALATGEEPISTETTQTGVSTRVLEIYGGPFDDEQSASLMHQQAPENCGWAGNAFMGKLLKTDPGSIREQYEEIRRSVSEIAEGTSGAHIAGISAVTLADAIIETWFFENGPETENTDQPKRPLKISPQARERAIEMAKAIIREQLSSGTVDVNESAANFIVDWILSNRSQFGTNVIGTCLGTIEGDKAFIYPSLLNQALTKAGYSSRKTRRYLADNGIISSRPKANGGKEYIVSKWFGGRVARMIEFNLGQFAQKIDVLDEDDAAQALQNVALSDCALSESAQEKTQEFVAVSEKSVPFYQENETLDLPF